MNRVDGYRFGTVGPALPGTELRLGEDDELLIKSDTVFLGYFKEPEATRAILDDDGWLHSGDVASIDADGFVTITDRMKDILITAGGKNVAPANLEGLLKASPYVSQAVVIGDRRPYVAALITLEESARGLPRHPASGSRLSSTRRTPTSRGTSRSSASASCRATSRRRRARSRRP